MSKLSELKKLFTLGYIMGMVYVCIEIIYRSILAMDITLMTSTSLWMMPIGGFLGVFLGLFNESRILNRVDYRIKILLSGLGISFIELLSGLVLNRWWGFNIWDYTGNFGNILGQTDVQHFIYWLGLAPFGYWLDDLIRFYIYDEEKPKSLGNYYVKLFKKNSV